MDTQSLLLGIEQFLNSGTIDFILKAILLYCALLWVALIVWVTKDITNRTDNIAYQIACILLIIIGTPIFGLVIYLIARPSKTLVDTYYEELEAELLEQEAFIMKLKLEREAARHPEAKARLEKMSSTTTPKKRASRKPRSKKPKETTEKSVQPDTSSPTKKETPTAGEDASTS